MGEVGASTGVTAGREQRIDVLEPGRPQHRQLEGAISLSPLYVFTRPASDRPTSLFHKFLTARDSRVSLSAENSPSSNVGWSVDWLPLSLSLSPSSSISPVAFLCVPSASLGFPLRFAVTVLTLTLLLLLRFDMVL